MSNQKFSIYLRVVLFCWIIKCCKSSSAWDFSIDELDYYTLEQEILNLMGFPEAPKVEEKAPIRDKSASNYMMKLYEESNTPQPSVQNKSSTKNDVIINFMPYQPHQGARGKPDAVRRMWFDVSGVTKDNELKRAELLMYRSTNRLRAKFRADYKIVVDRVYHDTLGEKQFERLTSTTVLADFEGWIALDVTRVLYYWLGQPRDNRGLRIITFPVGREGKRVKPENIGIIGFNGLSERQPFISALFKHKTHEEAEDITEKSDVIISFMAQQPHTDEIEKPDHVRRMWFDASGITKENILKYSEFKMFRSTQGLQKRYRGAYEIVIDRVYFNEYDERRLEEIGSIVTPADYEGWITLNITRILRYWMDHPHNNHGIRVLTYPLDEGGERVDAEDIGIIGFDGPKEKQPFITGYYKNKNNNKIRLAFKDVLKRNKRSKRSAEKLSVDTFTHRQLKRPVSTYVGECKRHDYFVNFKDIRWHEWIIAPQGYNMHYCHGRCTFPLTTTANATNYAVVMSLFHQMHPDKVPEPCCIASKLLPLQLLYFENENRVVYKKYENMIADGCGCR